MLITKEQQEGLVDKYVKEKHTTDECIGFIDGVNETILLMQRITGVSPKSLTEISETELSEG